MSKRQRVPSSKNVAAMLDGMFGDLKIGAPSAYESEEKLIIALDFGTTFSGIAYCFPNQKDTKVAAILDWPGAEGESVPKIPTLINYSHAKGGEFAWGASVNRMQDNIVGVKLLLDPKQERPLYLPTPNMKRTIKNLPKPPVEIAADFIGAVYRHALSEIAKVVKSDYLKMCQKHFVLSVPAVWSDAAKRATMEAAKIAGIFPVTLIKEPEAAALYTMHSLNFSLSIGDAFVVCDAGGGTVDLISYEVVGLHPNLQVKELVPGSGGMAGSLGLNQRFAEAVKNLVGEDQFADLRKTKGFLHAEKSFDREIKRSFKGGGEEEEYFVNFPMASLADDPEARLESNCWRITGIELKAIFAPLITDILRMIDDQVKSVKIKRGGGGVTGIFLVGGFGSSQYLKTCVEREHPDIQVLQPTDAWAAIVKGAALSQLPQATVVATSAPKHYGTEVWSHYDPVLDSDVPAEIRRDGSKRAETMKWFIHMGDDIQRDQDIKFNFYRSIDEDYEPKDLIFTDMLYECADLHAPRHLSKGNKIATNCKLTADLRSVPNDRFKKRIDKEGKPYYDVSFDLVVSLKSALMTFSLEIDGKSMGSVKAKFN